ncbi:MAG TPA: YkgJ family cysteine cluster protein [Blastocatellia bacterium]|nr:YkgJ family cysteine cluster protein [Blastocatellia bacterium]
MNPTHATDVDRGVPPRLVQLTGKRGMSEADFAEMLAELGERRARFVVADETTERFAESVAESCFATNAASLPDCLTCGACCAFFHQVAVLDSDPTPRRLTWAVWDAGDVAGPKTRWLRREPDQGHCVAFAGQVGERARCEIYELRPRSCRAFEAGSDRCRAVRRAYGLEPRLAECERIEHAKRLEVDAGDALHQAEALTSRGAASFGGREKLALLGEMIDYNRARLGEILREAERLQALLDEKRSAAIATNIARRVCAINEEVQAVAAAIARGPVIGEAALLDIAAQSQAGLERAARWLLAIGEEVFAAFILCRSAA